jgi:hypothetical protein
MKKLFVIVIVLSLTFTAGTVFAQSAKDAVFGLKKLEARCQSGVSYQEYSSAIADAKFPVNLFMESEEGKKHPELTVSIGKVIYLYDLVGIMWHTLMSYRDLSTREERFFFKAGCIDADSRTGREIEKLYPQEKRHIDSTYITTDYYEADSLRQLMWKDASKELMNTTELYAKAERDKSEDIYKLKRENEQLKADAEIEKLKKENENLKKQLKLMKSNRKK